MIPTHRIAPGPEIAVEEPGSFVMCTECQQVHRITDYDQAPLYDLDGSSRETNDLREFLRQHQRHDIRVLHRASDVEIHSHSRRDPMRRVSLEVADENDHRFVVSCGRDDVESPRRYSITPGRLVPVSESIDLDTDLLRAIVDETLYPHAAPANKLERLIETCRRQIEELSWESFDPVDEDRDDPNTQLACLPEAVAALLVRQSRVEFPGVEGERLAEVIRMDLRFEIPVICLRRRYAFQAD